MKLLAFVLGLLVLTTEARSEEVAARASLTAAEYQQQFDALAAQGYWPSVVDVYATPQGYRYAAIWIKSAPVPAYIARHDLTLQQFQQEFNAATQQGYRLTNVSAAFNGLFAGIWQKAGGGAWQARAGLDLASMTKWFADMTQAGFRLTDIEGYTETGVVRFASIWTQTDGRGWTAWVEMTAAEYQGRLNEMAAKGFWPVHVDGYYTKQGVRFAAIFEAGPGGVLARHDLTEAQMQQAWNEMSALGLKMRDLSAYSDGKQVYFAAIWGK